MSDFILALAVILMFAFVLFFLKVIDREQDDDDD